MNHNAKILIITVPSWNSRVGANSWATLLEGYPSDKLASIAIRDEIPDSKVCSRYFTISENKVMQSLYRRTVQTGKEIFPGQAEDSSKEDLEAHNRRYEKMQKKRRYSMLLARELIWKLGRWRTPELDAFLDSFQPDLILHSMDSYIHLNRIVRYAIKRTGASAVGYIWDDNFTYKQSKAFGYKVYRLFQRASLKRLAKATREFFAITPFTKQEADAFFDIDCHLLTKPLLCEPQVQEFSGEYPLQMLYTGSLLIGRDRSLLRLCRALKQLNQEQCLVKLDVYTQTKLPAEMLAILQNEDCHIHAPIPQDQVLQKQREADILLFLEDIDGKDAKVARLSFSTKITDYLSAGKCIFALGNRDTAPIRYFLEHQAALVADSDEAILAGLTRLATQKDAIAFYTGNAREAAIKHHNPETIRQTFHRVLAKAQQS